MKVLPVSPVFAGYEDNCSTIGYLCPEGLGFFGGSKQYRVDAKADMWTVGCILHEDLTTQATFISWDDLEETEEYQIHSALEHIQQWVRQVTLNLQLQRHTCRCRVKYVQHDAIYTVHCDPCRRMTA